MYDMNVPIDRGAAVRMSASSNTTEVTVMKGIGRDTIQNDFGQNKEEIVEEELFLQQMDTNEYN